MSSVFACMDLRGTCCLQKALWYNYLLNTSASVYKVSHRSKMIKDVVNSKLDQTVMGTFPIDYNCIGKN